MKIFFDPRNLTGIVDKDIDFEKSHLAIDVKDANVEWVQYLKQDGSSTRKYLREERFIVVESGIIEM